MTTSRSTEELIKSREEVLECFKLANIDLPEEIDKTPYLIAYQLVKDQLEAILERERIKLHEQ